MDHDARGARLGKSGAAGGQGGHPGRTARAHLAALAASNDIPSRRVDEAYYILYGLAVEAVTAITEETIVNRYLLTQLKQPGWTRGPALLLSLVLRTSYHACGSSSTSTR